jgi:hypothetical protein
MIILGYIGNQYRSHLPNSHMAGGMLMISMIAMMIPVTIGFLSTERIFA